MFRTISAGSFQKITPPDKCRWELPKKVSVKEPGELSAENSERKYTLRANNLWEKWQLLECHRGDVLVFKRNENSFFFFIGSIKILYRTSFNKTKMLSIFNYYEFCDLLQIQPTLIQTVWFSKKDNKYFILCYNNLICNNEIL